LEINSYTMLIGPMETDDSSKWLKSQFEAWKGELEPISVGDFAERIQLEKFFFLCVSIYNKGKENTIKKVLQRN
jgi:hypothetical protein